MKKLLFILFTLACNTAWAQIPTRQNNTYVNDFAHVLNQAEIDNLSSKMHEIERIEGMQMAIVLVEKIPAQYNIQSFAASIGREWQVGGNLSGLVFVAATKQGQQYIEVVRDLDSVFTAEKRAAILQAMKPWFSNRNYAGGLQLLVGQIADGYNPRSAALKADTKSVEISQKTVAASGQPDSWLVTFLAVAGALLLIAIAIGIIWLFITVIKNQYGNNTGYRTSISTTNSNIGHSNHQSSNQHGSRAGAFVGGAAIGAATAYAANQFADDSDSSSTYPDSSSDDSGDSSPDSGFSDSDTSNSGATSDW